MADGTAATSSTLSACRTPLASVVVVTFNRPEGLYRCHASLAHQTLAPESFEVVVVDVSSPPVGWVLAPLRRVAPRLRRGWRAAADPSRPRSWPRASRSCPAD